MHADAVGERGEDHHAAEVGRDAPRQGLRGDRVGGVGKMIAVEFGRADGEDGLVVVAVAQVGGGHFGEDHAGCLLSER